MGGGYDPNESFSGYEPKKLFHETPSGRFEETSFVEGWDSRLDGRSLVTADLDGDGDLDLVMTNRNRPQLQLWENVAKNGHALELSLQATKGHREADGAVVLVEGLGAFPVVLVRGYASAVDPAVHVGLGERTKVQVRVRWRSGAEESFGVLEAGARVTLVEGQGAPSRRMAFAANRPKAPPPWPNTVAGLGLSPAKGPTVVQLFMQSCKSCRDEVPALAAVSQRGVRVVSLGLHEEAELAEVKKALGLAWEVWPLTERVAGAFEGPAGLILPTVLVYDSAGRLFRVVAGAGSVEKVLAELEAKDAGR